MPQLVPIRAAATDRCVPTTLQRISPSDRNVPSIVSNGSLNRVPTGNPLVCAAWLVLPTCSRHHLAVPGAPDIRLTPSTAVHRELLPPHRSA